MVPWKRATGECCGLPLTAAPNCPPSSVGQCPSWTPGTPFAVPNHDADTEAEQQLVNTHKHSITMMGVLPLARLRVAAATCFL